MRAALSGLTTRGRSFLAAGIAACLCGLVLREMDLLRVGIFLCALPIATAIVVARTRYRLSCVATHRATTRAPVGETAQVVLRVENLSRVATGILLLEDRLPYSLGGRPRFVVNRIESARCARGFLSGAQRCARSLRRWPAVVAVRRPLRTRRADPIVHDHRCARRHADVVPLPAIRLGGDWAGGGDSRARSISTMGEDDVTTREYRHGDDLRRVHWRSTARYGELMVRREEQPWQNRGVLLLDSRVTAHRGEGPGSSFEWAVSAIASIGSHLARDGFGLRFTTDVRQRGLGLFGRDDGRHAVRGRPARHLSHWCRCRAPLAHRRAGRLFGAVAATDLVIAALGSLTDADLDALARFQASRVGLRSDHARHVQLVVPAGTVVIATCAPVPYATRNHAQSCALLAGAGWRVVSAQRTHRHAHDVGQRRDESFTIAGALDESTTSRHRVRSVGNSAWVR